jgi:hypothetical protein
MCLGALLVNSRRCSRPAAFIFGRAIGSCESTSRASAFKYLYMSAAIDDAMRAAPRRQKCGHGSGWQAAPWLQKAQARALPNISHSRV